MARSIAIRVTQMVSESSRNRNRLWLPLGSVLFLLASAPLEAQEASGTLLAGGGKSGLVKGASGMSIRLNHLFPDSSEAAERTNVYKVEQVVELNEIQPDARKVQFWVSLPGDEKNQRLRNLDVVDCPGTYQFVKDTERRGDFLYVELDAPKVESIKVTVRFELIRTPEFVAVDSAKVTGLTPSMKQLYAEYLVKDAPHMVVTPEFQKIADDVCGRETNIAVQARMLLEHVASTVDHYSYTKDPNMPTCGVGDSAICKKQGGGCCTDLNSYFITIARARGIPSRLNMGYRLQEKNCDKQVDPGYRCWVEYFVPGYGWVSADIVEADTPSGLGPDRWLSGLTSRRIWLNRGREFEFAQMLKPSKINLMTIGYAEIDGKAVRLLPEGDKPAQLQRRVHYTETAE
jgi:hypothetical protein